MNGSESDPSEADRSGKEILGKVTDRKSSDGEGGKQSGEPPNTVTGEEQYRPEDDDLSPIEKSRAERVHDSIILLISRFERTYETDRRAAYFLLYSIGVSILLASLALSTDNVGLMMGVATVYAFSSLPFFYWYSQETANTSLRDALDEDGNIHSPESQRDE